MLKTIFMLGLVCSLSALFLKDYCGEFLLGPVCSFVALFLKAYIYIAFMLGVLQLARSTRYLLPGNSHVASHERLTGFDSLTEDDETEEKGDGEPNHDASNPSHQHNPDQAQHEGHTKTSVNNRCTN